MTGADPGFDPYAHLARRPDASAACPLCGGIAGVDPHPELGTVCRLCGAPRIVMPEGATLDDTMRSALRKAEAARKARGLFRALGVAGIVGTAFGALVSLPILFFSFWASLLTVLFISAPSLAIALFSRAKVASKSKEVTASLDAAWGAATAELVRTGKAKTPADIAKALGIDLARAQQLMTLVSVDAEIGIAGAPTVRVDTSGSVLPPDPRFAELEARAAAEQQAEAEAAAAEAHAQTTERAK
ncbi:MAG: hypothetical protein HOV80_02695 [Polyangiaceae bacterium]|nr:hypothetical protein [Polyangiaceae bacterium]